MIEELTYTHEGTLFKVGRFNFLYRLSSSDGWVKSEFSLKELIASASVPTKYNYHFVEEFKRALSSMDDRGKK